MIVDYVSKYSKAFLNEIVMNEANYFIFRCSSSKKKIWSKYLKGPSVKYVRSKGEGGGQGKSVHLLFLRRHSIV